MMPPRGGWLLQPAAPRARLAPDRALGPCGL